VHWSDIDLAASTLTVRRALQRQRGKGPVLVEPKSRTAATTLLIMGVPARVVMQILGHSQIGLTLGTYSHVVPELANDAADKMAKVYWSELGQLPTRSLAARTSRYQLQTKMAPLIFSRQCRQQIVAGQYGCAARDLNPQPAD
jgi:hypothetical protein